MISARLDGELSPEEARELEEHLASCEDCRRYLRLLETVREGLGKEQLPAAPETLKSGIMYKIGLEKKRSRLLFGAFGRWTAIAAVICIAVFGVAKLGGFGGSAAPQSAERMETNAAYDSAMLTTGSGANAPMEILGESKLAAPASASGSVAPQMDLAVGLPNGSGTAPMEAETRNDALDMEYAVEESAEAEPEAPASVYMTSSLAGYDIGRSALGDGDYSAVCIFYDELPEDCDTARWQAQRPGEGELERWLVTAKELKVLEAEQAWDEYYFGDLSSGQGLVVVIAVEEEQDGTHD